MQSENLSRFFSQDVSQLSNRSELINSLVVPRPIAFITSIGENGVVNAAPFSWYNVVCSKPLLVSVAIQRRGGNRKDTSRNIAFSKEFVVNICSLNLVKEVSIAGGDFPSEISEIDLARLSLMPSQAISTPRISDTPAQLECLLNQVFEIGAGAADLILGEVIKVHVHRDILKQDGHIDVAKLNPLARLAGIEYAKIAPYCKIPRGNT